MMDNIDIIRSKQIDDDARELFNDNGDVLSQYHVCLKNTNFMSFGGSGLNFSADMEKDKYAKKPEDVRRTALIIIPDKALVDDLIAEGFNIRQNKPYPGKEDEYIPIYYTTIIANYDSKKSKPNIFLSSENGHVFPGNPSTGYVLLDESNVGNLDGIAVDRVRVCLNKYTNKLGTGKSLYIQTMFVDQAVRNDPIIRRYAPRQSLSLSPLIRPPLR